MHREADRQAQVVEQCNALPTTWACLRVAIGQEFKLRDILQKIGIPVYLPIYKAESRAKYLRLNRLVHRPLFDSYLFSSPLDGDTDLALRRMVGVKGKHVVVGSVDEEIINEIRAREDAQGFVKLSHDLPLNTRPNDFKAGEELEVVSGPFASGGYFPTTALFSRSAGDRIFALMKLFGEQREVEFTAQQLRRA